MEIIALPITNRLDQEPAFRSQVTNGVDVVQLPARQPATQQRCAPPLKATACGGVTSPKDPIARTGYAMAQRRSLRRRSDRLLAVMKDGECFSSKRDVT